MRLILTVIIAILAPLIHCRIPTRAEIKAGKVDGFTGATNSRFGDYLLSTTCFCGFGESGPSFHPHKRAIFILYEYYQYHYNTTYMLKNLCPDTSVPEDCFDDRDTYNDGYKSVCDTWHVKRKPVPGGKLNKDQRYRMCYYRDLILGPQWDEFGLPMADKITFNAFTRDLGTEGGQAPTLRSPEEADARCAVLCEQQTGLPVLKEDLEKVPRRLPKMNHMIGWEDLDDMCDDCR